MRYLPLLFALAWPATARALPPVASDVVVTRDGSTSRGRITEIQAGDHVTVTKRNGGATRIPWAEVVRIEREGRNVPLPGPPVRVHIEGPEDAALEVFDPFTREHYLVCYAPCDRDLPSGLRYRLTGKTVRDSSHFQLKAQPSGQARFVLDRGSHQGFSGGLALVVAGGVVTLIGVLIAGSGILVEANPFASAGDVRDAKARETAGGIVAGTGVLALMVPGVVLLAANGTTRVHQARRPQREPTWAKPVTPMGAAASVSVPLAALRF
jgi:hypothetical protein